MDFNLVSLYVLSATVPWDMVCYLLLVQLLPALSLSRIGRNQSVVCRYLVISQSFLVVLFVLVWGGYAKDSWEYLPRFDGFSDDDRSGDWLFWIMGYALNKLFPDPWPLKILSTLGAALLCYATVLYFQCRGWRYSVIGLFAILLVPAFYFLIGSAVRQGIAGALIVLGIVSLHRKNNLMFVLLAFTALFIHQSSIVFAAAGILSRFNAHGARYALAVAPFVSYVASWSGQMVGIDLGDYVPYSEKTEGRFHFEKFLVAYAIVFAALYLTRMSPQSDKRIIAAYAYMVAVSTCFLKYEVVFERLLGYSELLLPVVAAICAGALRWEERHLAVIWIGGVIAGIFLWTHPSIVDTLGYLTVQTET